ncbi:MAG: arylamine N-acetyltransferase [Porticoccaceae bacterium]|nr:arylamine N-acetyltransferase [Porticoccaceae bacterium]
MNLDEYFERIGYRPGSARNVTELHALTRAHAQSIPFENIDVLQGRPISLELADIVDKLVRKRRGGYCFEQNGLFMHVLKQLGFVARPLGARVRLRCGDRNEIPPRTHLFVLVEVDGQQWLTDVGVGGFSLTAALLWQDGLEQQTPHDCRRLVWEDGRWFHQVRQGNGWLDLYEFDGLPMCLSDQSVANWYTSTHPDSTFKEQLVMARADADGSRLAVLGNEFRVRNQEGEVSTASLAEADLIALAREKFNLEWPC